MFSTDIPNKIKQPPCCCLNCGKSYVKKANLRRHEVTCVLLNPNKKHKKEDEEEELPSYRELFTLVKELCDRHKKMEKKMEEYEKVITKHKKKINVIEWLNKNKRPEYNFESLDTKLLIRNDHIEFLLNHNYFELIKEIYKEYLSNSNIDIPIAALANNSSKIYIWTACNSRNEENKWNELDKESLVRLNSILQRNISKAFSKWKDINKNEIARNDKMEEICNKILLKIMSPECKTIKTHTRLKNILYNEVKTEMNNIVEYEVVF